VETSVGLDSHKGGHNFEPWVQGRVKSDKCNPSLSPPPLNFLVENFDHFAKKI